MGETTGSATTERDELPFGIAPPGYRLRPSAHPGAVRLAVADLARSVGFYETVLGFRVLERSAHRARLGAHGDGSTLVELQEQRGARPVRPRTRLGLFHYAILLPTRGGLANFVGHLGRLDLPAGTADHFVSEAVYLSDPDGLGIEVYADRPRSAWRSHGRELTIGTAPLNVSGLMREARGSAWTGLPTGTTMGHVHLHVGDLEKAAAFYHAALGLDRVVWSYPGALFLSAGGYHHHLGVNTWTSGARPPGADEARLLEWTLVVPAVADATSAAESISAAGHDVVKDDDGFIVSDPWGTRMRLASEQVSEQVSGV